MIQAQPWTSHGQGLSQSCRHCKASEDGCGQGPFPDSVYAPFHKPDGGNGLCFEQGLAEHGTEGPFA